MTQRPAATATVLADDARIRMTRFEFAPGAETGHHRHEHDYGIVAVTHCHLRLEEPEGVREAHLAPGEGYRRPVGVEHNVINAGEAPMAFVEFEAK